MKKIAVFSVFLVWILPLQAPARTSYQEPEEPLESFIPSEEVPAGGAISFPVDI